MARRLVTLVIAASFALAGCSSTGSADGSGTFSKSGDYDCAGGSGDGPNYIDGPVQITGGDRYGLDADGDGVGCE